MTPRFSTPQVGLLTYWMHEREEIRLKKEGKLPQPWTKDPVLNRYRFCNVIRMDDRVSKWLMKKWYMRAPKREMLVQATIARLINEPRTLACISPESSPSGVRNILHDLWSSRTKKAPPIFTSAYLVVGNEFSRGGKVEAIPRIIQRVRDAAPQVMDATTMEERHRRLMQVNGLGSFLAGQIVADLRYLLPVASSPDRLRWAPVGPGSARGMLRLLGAVAQGARPRRSAMPQRNFEPLLLELMSMLRGTKLPPTVMNRLEAMDLQNCLCEFDKYCRAVHDGGRPRRLYP